MKQLLVLMALLSIPALANACHVPTNIVETWSTYCDGGVEKVRLTLTFNLSALGTDFSEHESEFGVGLECEGTMLGCLRDEQRRVVAEIKSRESAVLLPLATLSERYPLDDVPAGKYELSVAVDFHDDGPVQSMVRAVEIATAPPPPGK
jgi:hypothetical protein